LRIAYDEQVDAAHVYLDEDGGPVAKTVPLDPREINGEINLDFDVDGRLIGIEVQDATRFLPPRLLREIGNS